ncbi:heterokaryon incompatibility protein-domain-containing protein [Daldinia loculata]|uniref:heterokaryon incompatibility protein-domain-containing protein n=1 Tax=Daldinia loculata TaxID=103429 RepID=UPI0020C56970|nr:heterokaryon incompatibility protein-domain-containing protein [Daldinia loculata]KAI1643979.1 heterokaryon incompatibility protein-domain-containing protein [Daldinia loculata]
MGRDMKGNIAETAETKTLLLPPPLLPVPYDAALPGDELCSACAALKLTTRRFIVFPDDPEYKQWTEKISKPVHHASIADIRSRTHCPLCRLLLIALGGERVPDVDRRNRAVQVGISWGTDGHAPSLDEQWATLSDIRAIWPELIVEGGNPADIDIETVTISPQITLLLNDAPADTPPAAFPFLPRPMRRDYIDFDLVRYWLAICETRHRRVCHSKRIMREMDWGSPVMVVPDFRCVDLEEDCLVRLRGVDTDLRYAALSYVWGQGGADKDFFKTLTANVIERETPGFFARNESQDCLPATIRDAMTVVRRLGLRYIWIDSLCIVQDGQGEDWLKAIQNMDLVYGAAYVVICAVGSASAFEGIKGVEKKRGSRSNVRNIEQIADGFRLAYCRGIDTELEDLTYYTRGWTYQEQHFACRALIFTDDSVSLQCRCKVHFSEDTFEDTTEIKKPPRASFAGNDNDIGDIVERHIQNYSERHLTEATDIYRAFAGVARQICRNLKSDLCHGLPARFFDWFLLWEPLKEDAPRRRAIAPSWSWAGWHDPAWSRIWDWYTRDIKVVRHGIRKRTWIMWYQRKGHESTSCELVWRHYKDGKGRELNFYGGPVRKKERFALAIDCSTTEPTARTLTGDGLPQYTDDILSETPGSGLLQFWTVSATFELRRVGKGDDGVYGQRVPRQQAETSSESSDDNNDDYDSGFNDDEDDKDDDYDSDFDDDDDDDYDSESNDDEDDDYDPDKQPGIKLIIAGQSGLALGRIYVPTNWSGLSELDASNGGPYRREFVVLCEARDERAKYSNLVDEDGGWRYRIMLVDPKCGGQYFEKVSVGSVGLGDLNEAVGGLVWKEFILG